MRRRARRSTRSLGVMNTLGIQHYWVFLATGIVLNLTPGQDTLYIVGRSIAYAASEFQQDGHGHFTDEGAAHKSRSTANHQ